MLTVITETTVRQGSEADWDRAYRERAADAQKQPGWVDLHLLVPEDDGRNRVVVGTWQDRAAWEAWHTTDTFKRTREQLDAATEAHGSERWFRVAEQETS
jgi:heme-degrading monooxygenase HmoA